MDSMVDGIELVHEDVAPRLAYKPFGPGLCACCGEAFELRVPGTRNVWGTLMDNRFCVSCETPPF